MQKLHFQFPVVITNIYAWTLLGHLQWRRITVPYYYYYLSHTRTVVQECFKGDEASQ